MVEDDIKNLAESVLHHRLIFKNKESEKTALHQIIQKEIERLTKLKLEKNH